MSDPERLLKSSTADPEVRELLQSLRGIKPSSGAAIGSWGAMAAKVATLPSVVPPPSVPPVAPHGAVSGASHVLALKVSGALVATSVLGGGLYWARAAQNAGRPSPLVAPVSAAAAARPAPVPAPESSPGEPSATIEDTPPPPSSPQLPLSAAQRVSRLDAEASLLSKVRAALRSGDAHGALIVLNQLQAQFPKGALGQERDVLAVEVLAANGNTAAAKRKAAAFIAAHPSSPHSAKLERFVEAQ